MELFIYSILFSFGIITIMLYFCIISKWKRKKIFLITLFTALILFLILYIMVDIIFSDFCFPCDEATYDYDKKEWVIPKYN